MWLIATTSDIRDEDFLGGHYAFGTASANPDAAVINKGSIKAATGAASHHREITRSRNAIQARIAAAIAISSRRFPSRI